MPEFDTQASQTAPPIPPVPTSPGRATGAPAPASPALRREDVGDRVERTIREAIAEAENAAAQGEGGTVVPPPAVYQVKPDIPPEVIPLVAIVMGSVAMMVIVTPIIRGIIRFIERRQDKNMVNAPSITNQLLQLQQSVDTLAIEMERISESQRFQAKILAERDKSSLPSGKGGA